MHLDTNPTGETRPFPPTRPMQAGALAVDSLAGWGVTPTKAAFTTSMQADLRKLANSPRHCSALAVVAASVRHSHPMAMKVQVADHEATLAVFPRDRQYRCELDLCQLPREQLAQLRLVLVMSSTPLYPTSMGAGRLGMGPLGPMLWQLAKYGPTDELLPEIAGPAVYRLAPSLHLADLPVDPELIAVLQQMRRRPCTVEELAARPGFSRARVCRLLNAIYLQAGLIVTRSLPKLWA